MSTDLKTKSRSKTEKPKLYAVVFVNDDFTPMDFVIAVLMQIFGHDESKATAITMDIHKKGKGVAGIYTHEIAETKAAQTMGAAIAREYPLRASVESEQG